MSSTVFLLLAIICRSRTVSGSPRHGHLSFLFSVFVSPSYAFSPTPFTAFFSHLYGVGESDTVFFFRCYFSFLNMVWCNIYTWTCLTKNSSLSKLNSHAMFSCHISMRYSQLFIFYGIFKHSFI